MSALEAGETLAGPVQPGPVRPGPGLPGPVLRGVVQATTSTQAATPLLVLGPSLGTLAHLWTPVARGLLGTHRVLRFDLPGHGISPPADRPFTVAGLADSVVSLVDSIGGGQFAYAGVSLGGALGIELATGPHAARLDSLAVICADARIGTGADWAARAAQVRAQGTASMVSGSSERWFAPGFLERDPEGGGRALRDLLDIDDESYALCCAALATFDRRADASRITARTLVVTGDSDRTVTVADGARLAAEIAGSTSVVLERTGHQAHVESPAELLAALRDLLDVDGAADGHRAGSDTAEEDEGSRYREGLAVRRAVLGDRHVDASLQAITPETADFQHFITEYAWGTIWTRAGLDRRLRSAVTLSSLVTGHHWNELAMHVRAALTNGLTRDEVVEILLQTAIYAGVPAANSAFGVAKRVFADIDSESAG